MSNSESSPGKPPLYYLKLAFIQLLKISWLLVRFCGDPRNKNVIRKRSVKKIFYTKSIPIDAFGEHLSTTTAHSQFISCILWESNS